MSLSPRVSEVLASFSGLPPAERFHLWARAFSCPMDRLAELVPAGKVLEVGCGHGLFSALLASRGDRQVKGIDLDERKISHARLLEGQNGLRFAVQPLESEPERDWDAIAILDVLYLVPREKHRAMLEACVERLKPGGLLLLKEVGTEPRWKHAKAWLQEVAMVRLLGRTHGQAIEFLPADQMAGLLRELGLRVEVRDVSAGYTTPHVLFLGRKPIS